MTDIIKPSHTTSYVLLALCYAAAFFAYVFLPDHIMIHFDANGFPNTYMPKLIGVLLLPTIFSIVYLVFRTTANKLSETEKIAIQGDLLKTEMATLIFGLTIQTLLMFSNLFYFKLFFEAMIFSTGVFLVYMGFITSNIGRNRFFGIRTKWTLTSDHVWAKTNRLGGHALKATGIALMLATLFRPFFWAILFLVLSFLILIPYSYLAHNEGQDHV